MNYSLEDLTELDTKLSEQETEFKKELDYRYDDLAILVLLLLSQYKKAGVIKINSFKQYDLERSLYEYFKKIELIASYYTKKELSKLAISDLQRKKIDKLTSTNTSNTNIIYAQELAKKQINDYQNKINAQLKEVIKNNTEVSKAQIKNLISDTTKSFKNIRAGATAETEANRVTNDVKLEMYKEAGIKKKQFTAVMDNRTTNYCINHNLNIYPLSDNSIMLPAHVRCRSYWVAIAN